MTMNETPVDTDESVAREPAAAAASESKARAKLAEVIVVTSGKGGVGKTTTSASLACGLARAGKKVAVIDFDIGLRNLDLVMGCERRVVYDFVNVIQKDCTLRQALIKDKRLESLHVLAASQTRDKDALTSDGVKRVLDELVSIAGQYRVFEDIPKDLRGQRVQCWLEGDKLMLKKL